jgi:DNA-binding MarR family transcriptional regulator
MVHRHEPVSMNELARLLEVSPPSASNMVERLVEKGLLVRETSREDRRKVVISVSPSAVKEIQQVESSVLKLFIELVERVGPQISKSWCEVLAAVKGAVDAERLAADNGDPL